MSIDWYQGKTFTLDSTSGEGENLFGIAPAPPKKKAPRLRIRIAKDGKVHLSLSGQRGSRRLRVQARYIDGQKFESFYYPDPLNDIIVGHFDWGSKTEQQLFLMWVRPDPEAPKKKLRLGFFIFAHDTRFSCGKGPMIVPDPGQQNGGGTGTGPH